MLVTERDGRLRLIRNGILDPKPVEGVPTIRRAGLSGLMDVDAPSAVCDQRLRLSLVCEAAQRERNSDRHCARSLERHGADRGSRRLRRSCRRRRRRAAWRSVVTGRLYVTTGGGGGNGAQDPNSLGGKVLRLKDDGTVPSDNPFVGRTGHRPEIFTLGHRSSLGTGDASGYRRNLAERERTERRRRDQHPQAGRELWLADRQPRANISGALAGHHSSGAKASSSRSSTGRQPLRYPA